MAIRSTFEDASRSLWEPYGEGVLSEADRALLDDPGAGTYVDRLHFDPPFHAALADLTGGDAWRARLLAAATLAGHR